MSCTANAGAIECGSPPPRIATGQWIAATVQSFDRGQGSALNHCGGSRS
jgi:hypothetical protein